MHSEPDVTRIVRSWLRTDEHESADRVLDTVLGVLASTPQRRSWWPARRIADMNNFTRLLVAAAAVAVVAVAAVNFLPGRGGAGGAPEATPSASPTPTTAPTPAPTAAAAALPPAGDLAIGRHDLTLDGVSLSLEVPSGWISNGQFGIDKSAGVGPDGAGFILWPDGAPVGVFADPCTQEEAPPIGSSAAELAAAVATVPGTDLVSGPTDVTVGGYPARNVVLTFGEDADCNADGRLSPDEFYLWYAPGGGNARYATELGSTIRVWIVDVDGAIVWIDGETYAGAGPGPGLEIQQIIDSIRFE